MPGTLYVVATPLGNLDDLSPRAAHVLRSVPLVAAEDTRRTGALLRRLGASPRLVSYHDHVERRRAPGIVRKLLEGTDVALVCDAGTPCISDPGYRLVRAAVREGIPVTPIPGPCAPVAALSVSGLPSDRFCFEGFVPAREGPRRRFLERIVSETRTVVFFETGRRLNACLQELKHLAPEREMMVARELTKRFETFYRGTVAELAEALHGAALRGEVTIVLAPPDEERARPEAELRERARALLASGLSARDAASRLSAEAQCPRSLAYRIVLEERRRPEGA